MSITDEQFARALNLSINCSKKGWQFNTELMIARTIAKAKDKELIITKIENIIDCLDENTFVLKLQKLRA